MKHLVVILCLMALTTMNVYGACEGTGCTPTFVNYSTGTLPGMDGGNTSLNMTGLKTPLLGLARETAIKLACILVILIPMIAVRPPRTGILLSIIVFNFFTLVLPTWFSVTNDVYSIINFAGIIILVGGKR